MKIRAKFMLQEHRIFGYGSPHRTHTFIFRPQYDTSIPEDRRFALATPTGEMSITVDNPTVLEAWMGQEGKQFYLDFTPAPDESPQE